MIVHGELGSQLEQIATVQVFVDTQSTLLIN